MPKVCVLLHGFLRTGASMRPLARRLQGRGYEASLSPTFGYHRGTLEQHAARAAALMTAFADRHPYTDVDAVTHSYGGVLLRAALATGAAPPLRRVVMIAPPNQGARLAERIRGYLPLHRTGWDPLAQFLPGAAARFPPPAVEVGILAGGTGTPRGMNPWLGSDNDGTVCVDECHLDGAVELRVIPVQHSWMLYSPRAIAQVLAFLEDGRFRDT